MIKNHRLSRHEAETQAAPRRRRSVPVAAVGILTLAALHACHHDESRAAAAEPAAPTIAAGAVPAAAPANEPEARRAAPEFHEATFDLVIRPVGKYVVGQNGAAEVEVKAKGGYHCNDKYPYKFKVAEADGVKFASPVFTKDAVQLEPMRAVMKVSFVPQSKGEKAIGGTFAFSLCSAERCLVEKRDLSLKIAVD